ncbi:MAG: DUF1566 domain-containing protein [Sulfurovum sp.]|nr:DUF1566 domain-containing protein [Sulfurovum sp.]
MKKILLTGIMLSTSVFAGSQWVTPSKSICTKNNGTISTYGVCQAKWNDAKEICKLFDARLPTLKELQKEVDECKSKNKEKDAYIACYKKKGFTGSSSYWSADTDKKYPKNSYGMNFYSATSGGGSKDNTVDVRCVK